MHKIINLKASMNNIHKNAPNDMKIQNVSVLATVCKAKTKIASCKTPTTWQKKKKKIPFTQQNVQFPTSFTCEEHHNPVFQILKTVNCLPGFTNRPHHDICVCKLEFAYLKLRICPRSFRMNCGSFQPISPLQTWSCLENQRINQINCDLLH